MLTGTWPLTASISALIGAAIVLVLVGSRFTRVVDRLADRTGLGEAIAGAVLVGATTSLPGLVTTITAALSGDVGFAVANAVGGIAVQTTFLAVADLTYRRANLEHAAASLPNLLQTIVLVALIGIVLAAAGTPESVAVAGVHPASFLLIAGYAYGLVLVRSARRSPMWRPESTTETREDVPGKTPPDESLTGLWVAFAVMAVVVAVTGWVVARAGLSIVAETGISGPLIGALITGVITSLPELVTALSAVRIGALTLAVGDIVGGNTFDILFVAAADIAARSGSAYHALDAQGLFILALTVLLSSVLAAGMVRREQRHIGFEGVAIIVLYLIGIAILVATQ